LNFDTIIVSFILIISQIVINYLFYKSKMLNFVDIIFTILYNIFSVDKITLFLLGEKEIC